MRRYYKAYKKVGRINTSLIRKLGLSIEGNVYASPGVINHIKKHHGKQLTNRIKINLIRVIKEIIDNPDYVGINNKRGEVGAIEFIKKVDLILLLGLEIDMENRYIYVSTLYPITKGKIDNRIYSGRIIKFNKLQEA